MSENVGASTFSKPKDLHGLYRDNFTYMKLSLSREAATFAATQEFPKILWNLKVHYHVYKSPPLVRILSHISPVDTTVFLSKILYVREGPKY
jgi:hypothetical protein